MTIPCIYGVNNLTNDYDVFLVDAWGVLHDGVDVFDDAISCLKVLKDANKTVIILSNAARRSSKLVQEMDKLGVPSDHFDFLFSSGEEAWQAMFNRSEQYQLEWGRQCLYIGNERSRSLLDGLDIEEVSSLDQASFMLVTGVENMQDRVEKYDNLLLDAASRNLPMVCANSDRIAVRGGVPYFCGGALAIRYRELGGRVFEFGKPHRPIYERCLSVLPDTAASRILAIGDSFETDMPGASNMGIDSLFVTQGIHVEMFQQESNYQKALDKLMETWECQPRALIDYLKW
ncbi:MAG: TIGR01459 family HAD-type hydrolase [Gammaproteobacteria bacterium]|jgi:HAD superfamily hydrolase (TIGR01459 family)|nr:TIGR01459 family HAD-type hydrolase [Gammaproteobacteria bacterium]MBT3722229.1 TIGR01459 family HAD-type hydrolase [Gammaproteobacteria bacterium]MBT4076098.1 TIGR01459 family HAD-type hydrolase [Gammaproteobacteria bacterium]MBT4193546.1 TIGR01459 family HAD-type hydrolase [Gammaproteobacteria bacterium]MBT4452207.1 TIGR01459 family HAD-type hydrolase [Gammaproteobacteria bacterium]